MLSLVIPAHNEARRLPASLSRCAEFFHGRLVAAEIVVADDGSTDSTRRVVGDAARELGSGHLTVRYLPLPQRGRGAAVRAGMLAAEGDPVIQLDPDLAEGVEIVDTFVSAIRDGADVVAPRAAGTFARRGAVACTQEAARALFSRLSVDGPAFEAELLLVARHLGYRVIDVDAELPPRSRPAPSLGDIAATARDLVLIRWRSVRGAYDPDPLSGPPWTR